MTRRAAVRRFDPLLIRRRQPSELELLSARALDLARQMEQRLREIFPPLSRAERAALRQPVIVTRRTT